MMKHVARLHARLLLLLGGGQGDSQAEHVSVEAARDPREVAHGDVVAPLREALLHDRALQEPAAPPPRLHDPLGLARRRVEQLRAPVPSLRLEAQEELLLCGADEVRERMSADGAGRRGAAREGNRRDEEAAGRRRREGGEGKGRNTCSV